MPDNLDQTATSCQSTKFNSPSPQVSTSQQQQLAQQSALDQLVQTYITMGFPPQVALQAAFQQQQSGELYFFYKEKKTFKITLEFLNKKSRT